MLFNNILTGGEVAVKAFGPPRLKLELEECQGGLFPLQEEDVGPPDLMQAEEFDLTLSRHAEGTLVGRQGTSEVALQIHQEEEEITLFQRK